MLLFVDNMHCYLDVEIMARGFRFVTFICFRQFMIQINTNSKITMTHALIQSKWVDLPDAVEPIRSESKSEHQTLL
jgi:hypothetical protein